MPVFKIILLAILFIVSIFIVLKGKPKVTYTYFMVLGVVIMILTYTSPKGTTQVYAIGTILGLYLIVKNYLMLKKLKERENS